MSALSALFKSDDQRSSFRRLPLAFSRLFQCSPILLKRRFRVFLSKNRKLLEVIMDFRCLWRQGVVSLQNCIYFTQMAGLFSWKKNCFTATCSFVKYECCCAICSWAERDPIEIYSPFWGGLSKIVISSYPPLCHVAVICNFLTNILMWCGTYRICSPRRFNKFDST